jgi:cytochrome c-type biogenesis protein CcmF
LLPELGHFALILALCLCVLLGTFPLYGAASGNVRFMGLARPLVAGVFVFIGLAYVLLTYSFAVDDFSVTYIQQHSNSLLPFRYKLTAVWGGHEGSFLLWTFMLAGWMLAVAVFSRSMPLEFVARVLGVLGLLSVGYLLFMLATSNPFDRIVPLPPADGADLNSALQDFGFIVHPPTLYMGYVGFSVVFAFAMAALLSGRLDAAWARWCRPWANVAWAILTIGIALGSWWAYYELGWGGWWAWDPVENPPLITWLFGTALIHSLAVTEKRGIFKSWTVMLAILAFAGSLLGTFITRSGLLTSVHAFATDPERGVFILAILTLSVGGALLLFALRAPLLRGRFGFGILSREMLLLVNNLILVVSAASVFLGTLFPMVYQALTDDLISIGPPYFNAIFVPLMALLALVLGVGPISRWKKTSGRYLSTQLLWVGVISLGLGIALPLMITLEFGFGPTITIALALWILLSAVRDIKNKVANKKTLALGWPRCP